MRPSILLLLAALPMWPVSTTLFATKSDVTSSRALATVYQNTTSGPMLVSVTSTASSAGTLVGYSDSSSTPTVNVAEYTRAGVFSTGLPRQISFVVPPNYYYEATSSSSAGVDHWIEWISGTITTTQTDVSGSRSMGTVYQNTSGSVMVIGLTTSFGAGIQAATQIISDTSATPTTVVSSSSGNQAQFIFQLAMIPNNSYYKATQANNCAFGCGQVWFEWTFSDTTQLQQIDVTSQRSVGTVYRNTSGSAMLLQTTWQGSPPGTVTVYVDSASTPTQVVGSEGSGDNSATMNISVSVPNGYYYEGTVSGGGGIGNWIEVAVNSPFTSQLRGVAQARGQTTFR